jgi:hypothetical protein
MRAGGGWTPWGEPDVVFLTWPGDGSFTTGTRPGEGPWEPGEGSYTMATMLGKVPYATVKAWRGALHTNSQAC